MIGHFAMYNCASCMRNFKYRRVVFVKVTDGKTSYFKKKCCIYKTGKKGKTTKDAEEKFAKKLLRLGEYR